jgi:hypothetical protein
MTHMKSHADLESTVWIFDSGATAHMTGKKELLTDLKPLTYNYVVKGSFGAPLDATHQGTLSIHEGNSRVTLDVLLVPGMTVNLISTTSLLQRNQRWTIEGTAGRTCIMNGRRTLMTSFYSNGLYIMPHTQRCQRHGAYQVRTSHPKEASLELWHRRLIHRYVKEILDGEKFGALGIKISDKKTMDFGIYDCEACIRAKHHSEGRNRSSSWRSTEPLQLIHSDLAGPINIKARNGGAKYTVSFIDDYSRYKTVYLLADKKPASVNKALRHYIARMERLCDKKVKAIRVDGGCEYKELVQQEIERLGLLKQTTCPDTPHQNGVSERFNRSLFEAVRALIASQKCHKALWGDAALYVTIILNKLPSSSSTSKETPFEMIFKRKPDLSNARVFGCSVYAKKTGKQTKLADRSEVGLFIGFTEGYKGWAILNTKTNRTTNSKDCIFVESPDRIDDGDMEEHMIDTPWVDPDFDEDDGVTYGNLDELLDTPEERDLEMDGEETGTHHDLEPEHSTQVPRTSTREKRIIAKVNSISVQSSDMEESDEARPIPLETNLENLDEEGNICEHWYIHKLRQKTRKEKKNLFGPKSKNRS